MNKLKLNLGSGDYPIDGYVNIDRNKGQEAYPLNYNDESVDEIRASHILEHFGLNETLKVLQCWVNKLKPGGLLKIAVPDFAKIIEIYEKGGNNTVGYLCGGQVDENDYHKSMFDRKSLTRLLGQSGLNDIKHWDSEIKDCASLPISLNLQGNKPEGNPELDQIIKGFSARKKNKYSQYGEDGITEAIFEKIGIKNKWCLEVGASDGMLFSNSRQFVEEGWNVILIESEKLAYDRLIENCKDYPNAKPIYMEIGREHTLDNILEQFNAPEDIDLMIIDIDGQDYHVWNAMMKYKPRVMIAEYNSAAESEYIPVLGGGDVTGLNQAGKTAMIRLAMSKGYRAIIETSVNIIALHLSNFEVQDEIISMKEDFKESIVNPHGVGMVDEELPPTTKEIDANISKFDKEEITQVGQLVETKKTKRISANITAIMSAPRLGFTNNFLIASKVLIPLGVNLEVGFGVFWAQVLSRIIEEQITKGVEWVVVLDYDSYYLKEHFLAMCQLMAEYPEVDAIMPIQIKREGDSLLAGIKDVDKANREYDVNTDLIEVDSGHFGLTFFRLASFAKLKKPWFLGVPNEKGEWGEGRLDDDIYFWKNWRECGLKLCLTPQVSIGHMQLMVTWPGVFEKGSLPYHQYLNDCAEKGIPKWCEVSEDYKPKIIK